MLKTALFFDKSWKNRWSVGGSASQTPIGLRRLGAPKLLLSLELRVTFEHSSDFFITTYYLVLERRLVDLLAKLAHPWLKPLATPLYLCDGL